MFIAFLNDLMRRRNRLPSQLAKDLGLSHATVLGWIKGKCKPDNNSCRLLAEYSGIPLEEILRAAGYLPDVERKMASEWPEFREYARQKYPEEIGEDVITIIEYLIERNRARKSGEKRINRRKSNRLLRL